MTAFSPWSPLAGRLVSLLYVRAHRRLHADRLDDSAGALAWSCFPALAKVQTLRQAIEDALGLGLVRHPDGVATELQLTEQGVCQARALLARHGFDPDTLRMASDQDERGA